MAKKLESIVELAAQKALEISANSGNFMAFLTTASHNFKYNFRDQLLIYAQKPDATACAQIDFWNKHGRYVNRGTTGIALLVDTDRGYKLRYVFDMSDTNSRQGRTIPIWQMEPRYEDAVIEALENSYGELSDRSGLAACLLETAKVIVEDNFGDYSAELRNVKGGSLLEELDDLSTETWFKILVENSVAFIMLTRCGIDPLDYFSGEDFGHVYDFDTPETLSILGGAVSDIAEMPLREIATTVLGLCREEQKENRTFAGNIGRQYNDGKTKQERNVEDGTDISEVGRLPPAQPGSAGGPEGRKIWDAAAQLPSKPQERLLHGDAPQRQAERPSGEDRPGGYGDGGAVDGADGAGAGRDGGVESQRPDEVGRADEQHPGSGGGSGADGAGLHGRVSGPLIAGEELPQAPAARTAAGPTGLQISHHDFNARTDIPYYHEDSEKTELLRISDALKDHRAEIAAFFEAHEGRKERGDFIKTFFDNTYVEKILSNGQRVGYRAWDDVLNLWRGAYLSREKEEFLRWPSVADTIYGMILLDQWFGPDERPLPSEAEQISFIEQAEVEKKPVFTLPQEAIDYVLCGGSGISQSKYRIYEQFQKDEDKQENIKFLRDEYGIGGHSDAIPGSGYWEDHDGKGITISRDYGDPDGKFLLTWAKVEKRIGELIAADRYLNRAEKEHYPEYQAQIEQRKARWTVVREIRSIIDNYVDFKKQIGETDPYRELLLARKCADSFGIGEKRCFVPTGDDLFVLPTLRNAMQTIIRDKTHLTERCETVLVELNGPLAAPLEPTDEELNPPKKEYRLALGDTVYLGAQEYELLSYDEQTVRLYDPAFPIFNKELSREEFDRLLAENPLNNRLLQVVEDAAPVADAEEPDAEEPLDAPLPVGRIDFLGTNGSVGESVEYTDTENFVTAIREENHVGVPMRIVLYRDGEGQTIPQDFLAELDPPPQGFEVLDMAQAQLERAKWLINAYCMEVFEQEADFSDLSHVPLAFSSTSDSAHTVEISVDLLSFRLFYLVDGAEAASIQCAGFHDLNELLANLDFDEMVAFAEEEYSRQRQGQETHTDAALHQPKETGAELRQPELRYQVVVYHHLENGMDEKLEYETPEEAEQAARGYLEGTMEQDGFAYEGAAVYDLLEKKWLRVIGDFPTPELPTEKEGPPASPMAPQEGTEKAAEYLSDQERIVIFQSHNGKFYNHYGYDEHRGFSNATAGGFDTFEEAEKALYSHRPKAEKVLEPTEKENTVGRIERSVETSADGHTPDSEIPAPVPPAPKRRSKVSSFILHPEVPNADRHEYHIMDDAIGAGTPGERFNNNVRAIRLLKKLEAEDRLATRSEQEVLARYVGWGGLADCFDERHSKYAELKALLTEDEYAAARESTLTAFYTPPVVIRSTYQVLENMGFKTGNILEPSCGIGNFIGMRPEALADSKIYGVELDGISGRIAQQLYQKSSIAVQGFEKTDLPDSFFDAAIGNVPFGSFKVIDKRYDRYNFLIHDYFFARTLDKVRPGGVIAFVTSKGTMDKDTPTVRRYIAQRADLLGAIRLPNNTFKDAAGTEVTSDILFLQKRDALSSEEPDWVHLNTDANGLKMNQYFIDHPEMVMGEMREVSGPYGPETACLPLGGQDLGEQLAAAIQNIQGRITEYIMDDPETESEDKSIPADPEVRNFSYTIVDGEVYYRENSRMNPVEVSVTAANRIKGLIGIRDCVRTLIEYQTEDWPADDIQAQQRKLNALYDAFVSKYGRINSRANSSAFSMDSAYFLLTSLEVLDDERNFVRKADMFTKRTIKQKVTITRVDTASEALAVSLAEKAKVDMDYMAELTGKTEQEVYDDLTGVIFLNPMHGYGGGSEEKYLTADEYLSGNVREKLEWAKRSAELYPEDYTAHVQALERVQPVDLTASEIAVRLGATWLPTEVIDQFIYELFGTSPRSQRMIRSHYSQHTGAWNIESKFADRGNVKAENTYGTTRVNGYKIIEETLNLRDLRIFDYVEDEHGNRVPILNKKETAIAQGKQQLIKQAFQDWIWKDPARRERLTRLYNDKFNSIRPREYDGSHLKFVGINPEITLRPHQVNAIAHILYGGNTLLAHVVGAGKTFEMVAAAQESKRLGLCQKSLFVVPNHLTEQWASEYLQLYPSANILVATRKDFETKNRKRFCGRIATGDYDAIIIGHSQFEKIPVSVERQRYLLEQQRSEVLNGIAELKANHGERFSIKQMERTKKSIDAKLAKLNDQSRKDDVVTFEELGIDRLFVDEAHYYKNLAAFSKMRNVGGISQTEAQKSSDLYMKCRYLDELTGGRGVVFATGTPISNTMVEVYTMQKYLQYHTLEEHGLLNFDAWASTFGETVTAIELAPEGTGYRAKTRFSRFYNLPELMSMFKEVADIQTADMLNLPVPKANYHNIVLKPSEQQEEMVAALGERAEKVRNRMVDSTEDNMLLITNDGRKLALDQRLLNPLLPDSDTSKINACAGDVFDIWQRTADQRSAQMVFCDLSTPGKNRPIEMVPNEQGGYEMAEFQNVYDDLRNKLIARGIPAEEIAYIHSANTETQKKELFGKVRSGQVRVLIGSTQKMGAGTNVQKKLVALHHLDCPWRPSDLQQREGRIIRQGNENNEVDIYTYVTENTFDSYLYQLVEGKQKFIGQIMTSKSPVRSCEDIDETALSYAEIKALCTGNPHIKEKMDLDIDVQRLRLLKANHLSQRYALEDQIIKTLPQQIAKYEQSIEGYLSDMDRLKENTHPNEDGFSPMEVEGTVYTDKKAAGSAILAACKAMTSPEPVPLGQYRGFSMDLSFASLTREFKVTLKGALYYTTNLGTDVFGNILRLDNLLESMEERINTCREQLENTRMQLENAKLEVDKPFPQEDELKRKSARLDELNILLNMDKRESEIVDGDVGDEVTAPARCSPDRER